MCLYLVHISSPSKVLPAPLSVQAMPSVAVARREVLCSASRWGKRMQIQVPALLCELERIVSSSSTGIREIRATARLARQYGLFTSHVFTTSRLLPGTKCRCLTCLAKAPRNEPPPQERPAYLGQQSDSKASFPSSSPSFDADDEDSLFIPSSSLTMQSETEVEGRKGVPRFHGEDTRATSRKELSGWYSYGFAAEVFVVCGVGSFIPIILEQLVRERGVLLPDKTHPCQPNFEGPGPSVSTGTLPSRSSHVNSNQCVFRFLGKEMNTASFAMYLLLFAFTGAVATMLFIAVVPSIYVFGAVLAIISNTCFGASFVLLNSFLPLLVRHHPSIYNEAEATRQKPSSDDGDTQLGEPEDSEENHTELSTDALLSPGHSIGANEPNETELISPELVLSTQISSYGIGIGYIAAVVVQSLAIAILLLTRYLSKSSTLGLRLVLLFVGSWWLLFTIPAALWLRPRPGPPIPFTGSGRQRRTWFQYIGYAWRSLGKTAIRARHLRDMIFFLCAWFLLSDSIATVSGTAVLFAKTQLEMGPAALAGINVIVTICGVFGAFTWSHLSRYFKARPSQTIIACICLFETIPLYGLLGFVPAVKRLGVFGLQQPWEMYPLGAVYGLVLGGLSSYCRSLFGELIPPGFEAAFYALYAITDKGSSIFGPAIVGAITQRYGEIRPAFVFLAVLIFIPLPLMMMVDVDRGKRDAAEMGKELEGKKNLEGVSGNEGIILIDEEAEEEDTDN